ncbi:MAG: hypothetical protein AAF799_37410 [Myxococcota bacterium]
MVGCATGVEDSSPLTTFGIGTLGNMPNDDGDTEGASSQGTGAGTDTGTAGDGASGSGVADETGGGETTSANGGESSGGPAPTCEAEDDDVPCVTCAKTACCEQFLACISEAQCNCALECLLAGGETGGCILTCGASAEAINLFNCAALPCKATCDPPR